MQINKKIWKSAALLAIKEWRFKNNLFNQDHFYGSRKIDEWYQSDLEKLKRSNSYVSQ